MSYYMSHKQMKKLAIGIVTLLMAGSYQVMASSEGAETNVERTLIQNIETNQAINEDGMEIKNKYWLNKGYTKIDSDGFATHYYDIPVDMHIKVKTTQASTDSRVAEYSAIAWGNDSMPIKNDNAYIDMKGHELTLDVESNKLNISGVGLHVVGNLEIKNIKGMKIHLCGKEATGNAIYVKQSYNNEQSKLLISNENVEDGVLDIQNESYNQGPLIYAEGENRKEPLPKISRRLQSIISIKGNINAIAKKVAVVKAANGTVTIGGGYMKAEGDKAVSLLASYNSGIFINSQGEEIEVKEGEKRKKKLIFKEQNRHHDVKIEGNVIAEGSPYGDGGIVGMALNTRNSYFTGLVGLKKGEAHMILSDGANWYHENKGGRGNEIGASHLTSFYGDKGVIHQNTPKEIIIDQYSGNTTVIYAHKNQGLKAEDYIGGDIRIGKFKEGSVITVSTSNENIDNYEDEIARILKNKIQVEGNLDIEVKASEGLLTAPRNFFTLFIDRSAVQEDSTEDPNIPDFKLRRKNASYTIGRSALTDAIVDHNPYFGAGKANLQKYPEQKDFTIRIRDGKHTCDEDEECTPYVLMGEEGGKKIYGGVGIMAKEKNVVTDMTSNNCEIEVLPHPMNQNIYGILAKNNKIVHMTSYIPSPDYLGGDEEEYAFYLKNKNKTTLSLDNSQDDSGNVYGIRAESGKIRIDANVEIIKAATKNNGYGTFDAISTVGKNSKIYLLAKFTMLGTAITGNVDKTKNARTAVTLAGDDSIIHIHNADIDNRNGGQLSNILSAGDKNSILSIDETKIYADKALLGKAAEGATINFNMNRSGTAVRDNKTDIQGDVRIFKDSKINVGIKGETSKWVGTRVLAKNQNNGFEGTLNVYLADKGTWESTGNEDSVVDKVVATGDDGTIRRSGTGRLDIKSLSGKLRLIYTHQTNGETTADYKEGDTHINAAESGAEVTVLTNKDGINMDNAETLNKVYNALAGKVYYDAYKNNEKNLKGKVGIAEGLLSTSKVLKLQDMIWKKDNGQGEYKVATPPPVVPGQGGTITPDTEDPNIPDFKLNPSDANYWIGDSAMTDGLVDNSPIFHAVKANTTEYPEQKDFTTRIRDGKHDCEEEEGSCTPYVLMGEEGGEKIYGGVGIMAKEKDVVGDMYTNNCEIEVLPHPMNQNIYGIIAKNNKILHMSSLVYEDSVLGGKEAYDFYLKNKNKITLSLDNSQDDSGNVYGIRAESGKIRIDSDVEIIKAATKNNGYGTFDAISTVGKNSKIYLTAKFTMLGTAITGNVDKTKNARTAVTLAGDDSIIHIHNADIDNRNGGQLSNILSAGDKNSVLSIDETKIYADKALLGKAAEGATINFNMNRSGTAVRDNKTDIQGDVRIFKDSKINVGIKGETSKWVGTRVLAKNQNNGFEGNLNVYLADKGTWESTGDANSVVDKVVATGDDGTIRRSGTGRLDIKSLSGKLRLIYTHQTNGETTADYKEGDTHINAAESGAEVTVLTDNKNIDTSKDEVLNKVYNALAGKVYYDAYKNNENNLKGKVGIAEGLLSTSKVLKLQDMTWKKDNGQGEYKVATPPPAPEPQPPVSKEKNLYELWKEEQIAKGNQHTTLQDFFESLRGKSAYEIWKEEQKKKGNQHTSKEDFFNTLRGPKGDPGQPGTSGQDTQDKYETSVMKGTRNSMLSAALLWRMHSNDLLRRMGDLRLTKEQSGVWAKYEGGQTGFDGKDNSGKDINISQKYKYIEVGYDTKVGDWTIGGAFEHGNSDDTYNGKASEALDEKLIVNGIGKVTTNGFAVYGTQIKETGEYIDIIARGGRIENKYEVHTENKDIAKALDDSIKGMHKATGLSGSIEYGKRINKENGFYVEPSAELTISTIGASDSDVTSEKGVKMHIHQDASTQAVGRIGILMGRESKDGHIFGKIALAHAFGGETKTAFSMDEGKFRKAVTMDLTGTWLDIELGGSYKMSDTSYIYGTFTKNFGAKLDSKWRLDAGIRFTF